MCLSRCPRLQPRVFALNCACAMQPSTGAVGPRKKILRMPPVELSATQPQRQSGIPQVVANGFTRRLRSPEVIDSRMLAEIGISSCRPRRFQQTSRRALFCDFDEGFRIRESCRVQPSDAAVSYAPGPYEFLIGSNRQIHARRRMNEKRPSSELAPGKAGHAESSQEETSSSGRQSLAAKGDLRFSASIRSGTTALP